jgi:hypothetical protein
MFNSFVLKLRNLLGKNHIMDNIFMSNISNYWNNSLPTLFPNSSTKFTLTPLGFTGNTGKLEFDLGGGQKFELRVYPMHTNPKLLYFELTKNSILYFPYMADVWNLLNSSAVKTFIITEWNKAAIRTQQAQAQVVAYY